MLQIFLLTIGVVLLVYSFFKWSTQNHDYFAKRGLKYKKPFPIFGNSGWFFRSKDNIIDFMQKTYKTFPNEKLIGMFEFRKPYYFLRDPKLIKEITVKNFDHFVDRRTILDSNNDKLFGSMLISMKGNRWREMRSSLSPVFTGSKMRLMFGLISKCGRQMSDYFHREYKRNGVQHYDVKDIFSKITNDIIATCAFGLECDSLKNPNNEFLQIGQTFLDFQRPAMLMKFLFISVFPKLSRWLNIRVLSEKTRKTFHEMIIDTMERRKQDNIIRPDMINLLMQLKDGNLNEDKATNNHEELNFRKNWTNDELVAQCLLFFLAGFDTTSTVMAFIAYELACHPEVQEKLSKEIIEIQKSLGDGNLSYENLQKMKYLEMVIAEALRKWPPGPIIDRLCVQDFKYDDGVGLKFDIKKGQFLFIPVYALHHDSQYFPDPDKFDPERFSSQNRQQINMEAYLPFGSGPRNCIASRFALMQVKGILFYMLSSFDFVLGDETQVPLKLKKGPAGLIPEKKIKLLIKPKNLKK